MDAKKYALVTGVAGGIGSAIAACLSKNDYKVIGLDNSEPNESQVVVDEYIQFDLKQLLDSSKKRQWLKERIDTVTGDVPLKVLVNNAAVQLIDPFRSLTCEKWQTTLGVNLTVPFLLTSLFVDELEKAAGSVVNLSSVHAQSTKPGFMAYSTSKSALEGMTRAMAVELGGKIRVNAIRPAATETPMLLDGFKNNMIAYYELARMHPVGRIADPAEIAEVVLFLASDSASFMTGSILNVDGGILARLHDPD